MTKRLPPCAATWDEYAIHDAIIAVLIRNPQPLDRTRFVESLAAVQATTIQSAAHALEQLGGTADDEELAAAFSALRQACLAPNQNELRQVLVKLLATWTGQTITVDDPGKGEIHPLSTVVRLARTQPSGRRRQAREVWHSRSRRLAITPQPDRRPYGRRRPRPARLRARPVKSVTPARVLWGQT